MNRLVKKLVIPSEWNAFILSGKTKSFGFSGDKQFIHCCTDEQLLAVRRKKYFEYRELKCLHVDLGKTEGVQWENGYPHIYGFLSLGTNIYHVGDLIIDRWLI